MIFYNGKLCALLPANEVEDKTLVSHQGLTYGGLLTCNKMTAAITCQVFDAINIYLKGRGFQKVIYKAIPWIYHNIPSEEDLYAIMQTCKARLLAREISTTIPLMHKLRFSEQRRRGIHKANRCNLTIHEANMNDIWEFWNILNTNLQHKYHTAPVHTYEELKLLMTRFPENIKGYVVKDAESHNVLAGSLIYITPQVTHTQYIAASPQGKEEGALDLLFDELINQKQWNTTYFDFGKSTEQQGTYLNENLIHQKEGFGGRGVVYDTYEWEL